MYSPVLSRDGDRERGKPFEAVCMCMCVRARKMDSSISLGFFCFRAARCSTTDKCQPLVIIWFKNSSFFDFYDCAIPPLVAEQSNNVKAFLRCHGNCM